MAAVRISKTLAIHLLFSFFSLESTEAEVRYLSYDCPNTTTFTPNSTYQRNINTLLSSMLSNTDHDNGFYNLTVGRGTQDVVYGLFLCRGDDTQHICQECISTAGKHIVQRCPLKKISLIFYDECMLRYSSKNFFSSVEQKPSLELLNLQQVSEPERFMDLLGKVMNNVTEKAANDPSGKRFATAEANFSTEQKIYALAQCSQDLTVASCNNCLKATVGNLPSCCYGREGGRVLFPSCNIRYELYQFYNIAAPSSSSPVSPLLPPSSVSKGGKRRTSTVIVVAVVVPTVICVILVAVRLCYSRRNRKDGHKYKARSEIPASQSLQFDLATIKTATDNFSANTKLGEGGFGEVYKGTLNNGQEMAVKRLSTCSTGQGSQEFKNEVVVLAMLQHRNLVRLLGFCLEREEKILIYEFVPNKSLDCFLFDPERRVKLDWAMRYKIIEGIARGIQYLHEDSQFRIIHRDLKASNILLDEEMNPKISDFGLAKIIGFDQNQDKTQSIVGTLGYMAPEYATRGDFSIKSDVYSFGVLILEIISGKKANNFSESDNNEDLLIYAWNLWRKSTPLELLDPMLKDSYVSDEVLKCIHTGLLCVQQDPASRPTMGTIMLLLNNFSVTMPLMQGPEFFIRRNAEIDMSVAAESDQSSNKAMTLSVNQVSVSYLDPR